ncbi:hypothetical protein GOP47_0025670 [Adiantum capillus-veneris]|uniref:Glycosyltransferase n=1 Tax=Adiantum capillus-veneris TaxID=13818 RepID=A0A9D4Z4C3_ADICA|nr:hypothetical protein GOP47_0025670 [Adiantum capillus-veneris]
MLYRSTLISPWLRFRQTQVCRETSDLQEILRKTAMPDNMVIITTLNEAWETPNSMIDLFLQSFTTTSLLNHLLIVALDNKSYERCLGIHSHCFHLKTDGVDFSRTEKLFMTPDYLTMMWTRIDFLQQVLEKGFSFIFSDADILWFRDPFQYLSADVDFQVACDFYVGDPSSLENAVNTGFVFARANNKTISLYKYWYMAREAFPGMHDQDVFNKIKRNKALEVIGLRMQFLDTKFISTFCQPSDDLEKVATMHANCCFGLQSKLDDLRWILADWNRYRLSTNRTKEVRWSAPKACLDR